MDGKSFKICSPTAIEEGGAWVSSSQLIKLGKGFLLLLEFGPSEAMEVGCDLGLSPIDFYMAKGGGLKLTQARSPPRLALPPMSAQGSSPVQHQEDSYEVQRKASSMESSSPATGEGFLL